MTDTLLASHLTTTAAMLSAGILLGFAYFAALRWTVSLYGAERSHLFGPAALTLGRLGGAAIVLVFAARLGALPLLATFLGFLLARTLLMHVVRRAQ